MKKKKRSSREAGAEERLPEAPHDELIKLVAEGADDEAPRIFNIAARGLGGTTERREFLRKLAGAAGLSAIAALLPGCENSDYAITADKNGCCTCHAVCACDVEADSPSHYGSKRDTTYIGGNCTCNTVCTCQSVCTCHTVTPCTCDPQAPCGCNCNNHSYWYPD